MDKNTERNEAMIREIRVRDIFWYYGATLIGMLLVAVLLTAVFSLCPAVFRIISAICSAIAGYYLLKNHAIGCVLMYKAFAPLSTRERCRYEPTCSTYMIMAIKKYGLFRGVFKGIKRIVRCHPPHGGVDYP